MKPYYSARMTSKELHKAIAEGNIALVEKLLSDCGNMNEQLGLMGTPLCAAVFSNQVEVAKVLIKSGAQVNLADIDGEPLLSLAIRKSYRDMAGLLIKNGANVNKRDQVFNRVPICAATECGLLEVMEQLLTAGAYANAQDSSGNTALHIATQAGDLRAMSLLLNHGCSARPTNVAGNTPLHTAVCRGDLGALWLLAGCSHPYPQEPFTSAEVEQFLETGMPDIHLPVNCSKAYPDNCTCARDAGQSARQWVPKGHVELRCDINQGTVFSKDTALHQAAFTGRLDAVKLLIHAGVMVDCQNNDKQSPLHMACFKNRTSIAQVLLESGANPNLAGERKKFKHNYVFCHKGMIPLSLAAEQNNVKLIELLLDHGANFGKTSKPKFEDANPLFIALCRSATDAAQCLLKNTHRLADTFDINFRKSNEGTFLFAVAKCEEGQISVAKKLIELGCDVNARVADGRTALHNAAAMECPELITLLIENGADWSLRDNFGYNPLHTCVINDQLECAKMLVSCGADVNTRTVWSDFDPPDDISPLGLAIECENFELVHYFLEAGADLGSESYLFEDAETEQKARLEKVYEEDEELAERLQHLAHQAPSLTCVCVRRIRQHFRTNSLPFKNISSLPIPQIMVEKILGKISCLHR